MSFTSLYAFKNLPDAETPNSLLVGLGGELYGTASSGGATNNGAIFEIGPSGSERVLYSFKGKADAAVPVGLTIMNGVLYGTSYAGGAHGLGTVFSVTTSGAERVLHSFRGGTTDGSNPEAPPTAVNGVLYGTTYYGGAAGNGTVFEVTPADAERVLYSFNPPPDGAGPQGRLTALNGKLFGTTYQGGENTGGYPPQGTVYEIVTGGYERVLHTFRYPEESPLGGVVALNGTLYGLTQGANYSGDLFEINPSGTERILYRFGVYAGDGVYPSNQGLTVFNGELYGTTDGGGFAAYPAGTVFKVNTAGLERVIYTFKQCPCGSGPGGLTVMNGVLYGTTANGGRFGFNFGTVFKLSL